MNLSMAKGRRDGLLLLFLGSLLFVLFGCVLEASSPATMGDFRMQYYPARTLVQRGDPYNQRDVLGTYRAEGAGPTDEPLGALLMTTAYIYPPTTFAFTGPLALMPYGPAHWMWMAASITCLITAGILMWDLGAVYSPLLSGALIGFLLANSELVVTNGNVAGIAIGLAVIAVWCFVKERLNLIGVVCLAAGLALKPHDTGLVWLYFLLAGGRYRRRALEALVVFAILSLPAILWLTHGWPHWVSELLANMQAISARGGTDPGLGVHGPTMVIDLQSAVSFFQNDPRAYNLVSYFVCGAILLVWSIAALRSKSSVANSWLALASIAALTMLPVYHRECDAKILLLMIPACAMLRCQGGWVGRVAAALTVAGLVVTADIPWVIDVGMVRHFQEPNSSVPKWLLSASQLLPAPIILLTASVFFLWLYVRRWRDRPTAVCP